ncbi:M48 family metallopeptidase [Paenibacillus sp. FSL H7-0331]|uniref:M48 family metallopeptidase n=1 Tax=Paenibacillus sp. FSL H7-0331 TaxID=1920421 RepID=UPI00096C8E9A|nr:M48 family metallopeptidase [Paenibacillus sp. FSL H7-0331]OMF06048.1 peptidase M48 [Paenibacillus sp. FSL H7-0331]
MNSRLVHEHETTWYVLSLVISLICYIVLIVSLVGIIYIVIGVIVTLILHGLMIAEIRSSGVKLTERQFPEVYWQVQELSKQMGIVQVPDVFIIQSGGVLNAFATRFFGRNFVVLYSEIFELIEQGNEEELSFVLAHELAHIQRKHMTKHLLILPALWIPFLGNAYYRSCEFTCDRIATAYIGDAQTAIRGLMILAVGKKLFPLINIPDYLEQSSKERGFFIWWHRLLSTHPPLPNRIDEILRFQAHPKLFGYDSIRFEAGDTKLSS